MIATRRLRGRPRTGRKARIGQQFRSRNLLVHKFPWLGLHWVEVVKDKRKEIVWAVQVSENRTGEGRAMKAVGEKWNGGEVEARS